MLGGGIVESSVAVKSAGFGKLEVISLTTLKQRVTIKVATSVPHKPVSIVLADDVIGHDSEGLPTRALFAAESLVGRGYHSCSTMFSLMLMTVQTSKKLVSVAK